MVPSVSEYFLDVFQILFILGEGTRIHLYFLRIWLWVRVFYWVQELKEYLGQYVRENPLSCQNTLAKLFKMVTNSSNSSIVKYGS
jgi:hypothetical protein